VTVVHFIHRELLTERLLEALAAELFGLVELRGQSHLLLDFAHIERLSSAMLGTLVRLHHKCRLRSGRLILCRIAPHLQEVFALVGLTHLVGIYHRELEALQAFQSRRSPHSKALAWTWAARVFDRWHLRRRHAA
jgi:anti-anti-sigma factor